MKNNVVQCNTLGAVDSLNTQHWVLLKHCINSPTHTESIQYLLTTQYAICNSKCVWSICMHDIGILHCVQDNFYPRVQYICIRDFCPRVWVLCSSHSWCGRKARNLWVPLNETLEEDSIARTLFGHCSSLQGRNFFVRTIVMSTQEHTDDKDFSLLVTYTYTYAVFVCMV